MAKSLVDKALSMPPRLRKRGPITRDEMQLAVAWAKDVVTTNQLSDAIGVPTASRGSVYNWIAMRLREAVRTRILLEKK